MATQRKANRPHAATAAALLEPDETTLLDLLDELLNKGVVLNGEVVLGVAGVDLVYLRLSSLLCAVDRVIPVANGQAARRRRRRNPTPRPLRKP